MDTCLQTEAKRVTGQLWPTRRHNNRGLEIAVAMLRDTVPRVIRFALGVGSLVAAQAANAGDIAPPSYDTDERFVLEMADDRLGRCIADPVDNYTFRVQCGNGNVRRENFEPYMKLPIRIGKSWTHRYREPIGGTRRLIEARVTARQSVTVPAGTYDTYRIQLLDRKVNRENGARETCWYAPSIQFPVRCEGTISGAFELVDHKK